MHPVDKTHLSAEKKPEFLLQERIWCDYYVLYLYSGYNSGIFLANLLKTEKKKICNAFFVRKY